MTSSEVGLVERCPKAYDSSRNAVNHPRGGTHGQDDDEVKGTKSRESQTVIQIEKSFTVTHRVNLE